MPFLVDSITMELARHDLDSYHIVHPQLVVRRDVTGELREVVGPPAEASRGHDEITESWTHIEIDTAGADPGRAGERPAAGAGRRPGRGRGLREDAGQGPAAGRPAGRGGGQARRPRPRRCCAGWPTTTSPSSATGSTTWWTGRTGWRCCRCPAPASASCGTTSAARSSFAALPPEVRARAKDPQRLILTKANSRSTVHRPLLPGLHRGQAGQTRPARSTASTGSSASTRTPPTTRASPGSRCCGASWPACWSGRAWPPDSHDGKDLTEILEGYPREELFQISVEELTPIALGRARACAPTGRPGCSCARTCTGGSCPAWSTCPGTGTPRAVRLRDTGDPARGPARGGGRVQRHGRGVGAGPAARGGAGPAGHAAARTWTPPSWRPGWRRPPGRWDEDLAAEAHPRRWVRRRRGRCSTSAPARSRRPTRPTCPRVVRAERPDPGARACCDPARTSPSTCGRPRGTRGGSAGRPTRRQAARWSGG